MAQANMLRKAKSLFSTTLNSGIGTGTSDTITPNSVTGLPTDTEITLTFDRVSSSGAETPSKMERITGTISGGNLTSYTRGIDGSTVQSHSAGAVIEYIWNADDWNDHIDHHLVEHNDDGTHDVAAMIIGGSVLDEDDMASNSATKLATQQSIKAYVDAAGGGTGWTTAPGTWTYASPTTITVPSGAASIYQKGDRIKLTQTTAKYFAIVDVADTLLTVTGGSDYSVANAAITSPYYSHQANPLGYPGSFAYTPTITSEVGTFTTTSATAKFSVLGTRCFYTFAVTVTTVGSATGGMDVTVPIAADAIQTYPAYGFNNATGSALMGEVNATSAIRIKKYDNSQPATTGGNVHGSSIYSF